MYKAIDSHHSNHNYNANFPLYWRDPNSLATLDVFQDAIDWAARGDFSDKDMDEAKLSVFSQVNYHNVWCEETVI